VTRFIYIIRELLRNLYRNPGTALGSLLSMTLLLLLLDLFWIAAGTSEKFYEGLVADLTMEIYLSESLSDTDLIDLSHEIEQLAIVNTVRYISKEEARRLLASQIGTDLLIGYDSLNPLPQSFLLTFKPGRLSLTELIAVEEQLLTMTGVDETEYSREWLEKVERTKGIILKVGLGLGLIIMLAALISLTNGIRVMTRARAVGFRQMLLQGASRSFVALPFLIEGFLMGGLSATFSWLVILYGSEKITFSRISIVYPTRYDIIDFCIVCAVLGLISGYLGIRKLLKV